MTEEKEILMDRFAKKAAKLGYKVKSFTADRHVYMISKGNRFFLTVGKHFPFNSKVAFEIALRKDLTKQILDKAGIPTPSGILAKSWGEVEKALSKKELKFPLAAKPNTERAGILVSPNITNKKDLKKIIKNIVKEFGEAVVEQNVPGDEYRFLVLDGKVISVAIRITPFVIGDGKKNLKTLIKEYEPMEKVVFKVNEEVKRCLKDQGYSFSSIPSKGEKVFIRRNSNTSTGANAINLKEGIDKRFYDIAVKAAETIGLRFAGIDIMTADISSQKSPYWVIEVNSDPGYDLHQFPQKGDAYFAEEEILHSLLGR